MERLAWAMTKEVFPKVDYYIDLHSGDDFEDLTPYVYYAGKAAQEVMETSRKMAEQDVYKRQARIRVRRRLESDFRIY